MTSPVCYTVRPLDPNAHLFAVECRVTDPDSNGQELSLPAWIPGSYMIRDFARHIISLEVLGGREPLAVIKQDKARWLCAPYDGPLTIRYQVYAWDLSVHGAHLDQTHGFFNGTSLFLEIAGHQRLPHQVIIEAPTGSAYYDWRVATTLPSAGAPRWGFGTYQADNYDQLIDHPVEMGNFTLAEFEACGVPHAIAISGRHNADMPRLCKDLKLICEQHIRLFGEPAPIDRYLFLVMAVGDGYGGLEHRDSTALMCQRDDLPLPCENWVSNGYRRFLGLCSHEYFHTWNIKRIKPAAFSPYALDRESYTKQLWAFEGITSYYDDLALLRCGLINLPNYLELAGISITRVIRGSGRLRQSVAESSFDAWTKFYRQDENAGNAIVSYYTKGAMVAMALDLTLRAQSDGQLSLDDVMRTLWQRYGCDGIGVPEGAIEKLAGELLGEPLEEFFAAYVHGVQDPPLKQLLAEIGIEYCLRPALGPKDEGGKPAPDHSSDAPVSLGLRMAPSESQARVAAVQEGGTAHRAGIAAGDQLIAVNGLQTDREKLIKQLACCRPDDRLHIHAFRRDELMEFHLVLQPAPEDTCYLRVTDKVGAHTLTRRQAWTRAERADE